MYEFKKMYLKLIALIVVLVTLIFLLISGYICSEQKKINEEYVKGNITKVEEVITNSLLNVANVAVSEAEDDDFRRYLQAVKVEETGYDFEIKQRIVNNEFLIYKEKNSIIDTISILGADGSILESSDSKYVSNTSIETNLDFVERSKSEGYAYGVDQGRNSMFMIVPIYEKSDFLILGYYVKEIKIEFLQELLDKINFDSSYECYMVLENEKILTKDEGITSFLDKIYSKEEYDLIRNQGIVDGDDIKGANSIDYNMFSKRLDSTSIDVVYSYTQGYFNNGVFKTIIILLGICIIIAIVAIYFSKRIINLLKKDLEDIKEIIYNYEAHGKIGDYSISQGNLRSSSYKEENLGLISREVLSIVKKFEQDKNTYNYSLERTNVLTTEYDLRTKEMKINKKLWRKFYGECDNLSYEEAAKIFKSSIHQEDRESYKAKMEIARRGLDDLVSSELRLRDKSGRYRWVKENIIMIRDSQGQIIKEVANIKDIDLEKQRELIMKAESELDSLTGYYNKHYTKEYINQYIESGNNGGVFILIDLDNFKSINDTFGHQIGDKVLRDLTKNIKKIFRKGDVFGRIGGDEFVIFIKGDSIKKSLSKKLYSLNKALNNEFEIDSIMNRISGSIGVSFYPEHATTYEELYKTSDKAMYNTKENGKNGYTIYNKNIKNNKENKLESLRKMEHIRDEIKKDVFKYVLFSPIEDLKSKKISSYLMYFRDIRYIYNGKEELALAKDVFEVLHKQNLESASASIIVGSIFSVAKKVIDTIDPKVDLDIPLAFKEIDYRVLLSVINDSRIKYSIDTSRVGLLFTSEYFENMGEEAHILIARLKEEGYKIGVLDVDGDYINMKTIIQYDIKDYTNISIKANKVLTTEREKKRIRETIEFCNKLNIKVSILGIDGSSEESFGGLDVSHFRSKETLNYDDLTKK